VVRWVVGWAVSDAHVGDTHTHTHTHTHTYTQFLTHVWAPKLAIVVQDPLDKKICQVCICIGGHEQIDVRYIKFYCI
jgi:hypothetical protein